MGIDQRAVDGMKPGLREADQRAAGRSIGASGSVCRFLRLDLVAARLVRPPVKLVGCRARPAPSISSPPGVLGLKLVGGQQDRARR
jgi:hypothetical protein